mmetsp:Transcript_23376/g.59615  ORF Transcript_23376/g.59615 Transcript_23376/m.59615 type:complete len:227 (+) Transcript_23376:376-1056(+)
MRLWCSAAGSGVRASDQLEGLLIRQKVSHRPRDLAGSNGHKTLVERADALDLGHANETVNHASVKHHTFSRCPSCLRHQPSLDDINRRAEDCGDETGDTGGTKMPQRPIGHASADQPLLGLVVAANLARITDEAASHIGLHATPETEHARALIDIPEDCAHAWRLQPFMGLHLGFDHVRRVHHDDTQPACSASRKHTLVKWDLLLWHVTCDRVAHWLIDHKRHASV